MSRRIDVTSDSALRRTAGSVAASATTVEAVRRAGHRLEAVHTLAQKEGFKGYSLFFAPSPKDNARYPQLKYVWGIGPDLFPSDTMQLSLSNVVIRLWERFARDDEKLGDQPSVISRAVRGVIGQEVQAGRLTVPLSQTRALRDTCKRSSSYKPSTGSTCYCALATPFLPIDFRTGFSTCSCYFAEPDAAFSG